MGAVEATARRASHAAGLTDPPAPPHHQRATSAHQCLMTALCSSWLPRSCALRYDTTDRELLDTMQPSRTTAAWVPSVKTRLCGNGVGYVKICCVWRCRIKKASAQWSYISIALIGRISIFGGMSQIQAQGRHNRKFGTTPEA